MLVTDPQNVQVNGTNHEGVPLSSKNLEVVDSVWLSVDTVDLDDVQSMSIDAENVVRVAGK